MSLGHTVNRLYGLCPWCRRKGFGSPFQQSHPHTQTQTQMYTHQSNHVSFDPDEYFCLEKEMISNCFCFFFFPACMHARLLQSRLTLTLWTIACKASLSVRFSRQEYWSELPCPPTSLKIKWKSLTLTYKAYMS